MLASSAQALENVYKYSQLTNEQVVEDRSKEKLAEALKEFQASFEVMVKISKVPTNDDCPRTPVEMKSVTVA